MKSDKLFILLFGLMLAGNIELAFIFTVTWLRNESVILLDLNSWREQLLELLVVLLVSIYGVIAAVYLLKRKHDDRSKSR